MRLFCLPRLVPAILLSLLATHGTAAVLQPITWGSATNISGDSDVVTTGTLVTAVNFGATGVSATTVNGVAFSAFGVTHNTIQSAGPVSGVQVQESPDKLTSSNTIGGSSGAYGSLSTSYKTLLGSAVGAGAPASMTVTIFGDGTNSLVIGRQYLLQVWVNTSGNGSPFFGLSQYALTTLSDYRSPTPATVTLDANTSNAPDALGQWVTGTFTATSTSTRFKLDSTIPGLPQINALQLRDITGVSVAESASAGWLLAPTLGAALAWRRRRNRR